MASFETTDKRTHYCGTLTAANIGEKVRVLGWCQRQRDLGSLIFIDLRDRSGIIQLAFDEKTEKEIFDTAFGVRAEFVLAAQGTVRSRGPEAVNPNLPTGEIEIFVEGFKVLAAAQTPPFAIVEHSDVKPELRLKHRYLDLRRPDLMRNIMARSEITNIARNYFNENGFIDIETPNLIKPTPEGARDYLVPSRVHPGKFYALPQSPQLYKQLLMYSGFDRYMQIARCYRDEDLRADRQPEFTQIDLEMSFSDEEDIMTMNEGFLKTLFAKFLHMDLETPFKRMTYAEAMDRFGSDKPDTRFGYELKNISDIAEKCGFSVFSSAVADGGSVRGIKVDGGAKFTRKEIDSLTEFVKTYGAKGLAWYKNADGTVSSSFAKFMTEDEMAAITDRFEAGVGDLILIVAAKNSVVFDSLGALRCEAAKRMGIIDKSKFNFLWVTEFPLLEYSEDDGRFYAKHHPFTMPMEEDLPLLDTDPGAVRARAYDCVLNGTELGGGSIRIHTTEMQNRMFAALGIGAEEAEEKFGFLLEAFKYGVPPHGGLAFGLDRLVTLILGLEDIRDVIAFPKVQNASELMSKCPAAADPAALAELGIAVVAQDEEEEA
ncbi:MAG: aspartate--tRNA ligase [Ruminococcaceae bacterium]|nr:aspartate--tRNA ligase [Oscillospiraceae bacterium]